MYRDVTTNLKEKVHTLIHTKENSTLSIAITLAENDKIRRALLNEEIYDLNELSKKLNEHTYFDICYDKLKFAVQTTSYGDVLERLKIRVLVVRESINIIRQILNDLPIISSHA